MEGRTLGLVIHLHHTTLPLQTVSEKHPLPSVGLD